LARPSKGGEANDVFVPDIAHCDPAGIACRGNRRADEAKQKKIAAPG